MRGGSGKNVTGLAKIKLLWRKCEKRWRKKYILYVAITLEGAIRGHLDTVVLIHSPRRAVSHFPAQRVRRGHALHGEAEGSEAEFQLCPSLLIWRCP